MKILVVDDEQDICEILQYNLETEGYEVITASSAEEALDIINDKESSKTLPDLILLDIMMGTMSGYQMAQKLKNNKETNSIPIIFITALDDEDSIVKGLNIGGDDYITKPLSIREVKARVRAVLRRVDTSSKEKRESKDENELRYEDLSLNLNSKTAQIGGENLYLTKLEFELLSLLISNQGKVLSREYLLNHCWPQEVFVLDRTVDVNITRLRKKVGKYGRCIKTRIGYGYCFEK